MKLSALKPLLQESQTATFTDERTLVYSHCNSAELPPITDGSMGSGPYMSRVEHIHVENCPKIKDLTSMPEINRAKSLTVRVQHCDELASLTGLPVMLRSAWLTKCPSFKSFADSEVLISSQLGCYELDNFERVGAPLNLIKLNVSACPKFKFKTLSEDGVIVKRISFMELRSAEINTDLINALLVSGLEEINITTFNNSPARKSADELMVILNKYLPNRDGMKTVRKCQSELVDAGFEEYAKL